MYFFSHPDCTVGPGFTPDQLRAAAHRSRTAGLRPHRQEGIAPAPEELTYMTMITHDTSVYKYFKTTNFSVQIFCTNFSGSAWSDRYASSEGPQ